MAKNWTSALAKHAKKEQDVNDRNSLIDSLNSLSDDYVLARGVLKLLMTQTFHDWYQSDFEDWLSDSQSEVTDTDILDWLDGRLHNYIKNEVSNK